MPRPTGFLNNNATKLLGFSQITVATIAASGLIPSQHMKYWMACMGLLTAWRGFFNSAKPQK